MTIKQASDLHFTYVRNTPELREVFINKCKEFGILVWGDDDKIGSYLEVFACPFDCDDKFEIVFTDNLEFQSKELFIGDLIGVPTETPEEKEVLDSIESYGEVEWKSGDECEIEMQEGVRRYLFGCECPNNQKTCIVFTKDGGGHMVMPIERLKKPETPQQRKDREQLEAAYDLYCHIAKMSNRSPYSFEQFSTDSTTCYRKEYLEIVCKTNYRKQD